MMVVDKDNNEDVSDSVDVNEDYSENYNKFEPKELLYLFPAAGRPSE